MGRINKLSQSHINLAIKLKELGFSKRKISELLEIAETTIWDNIYKKKEIVLPFRDINIVINIIKTKKNEGLTSLQVSQQFDIPLGEVNYIWTKGEQHVATV